MGVPFCGKARKERWEGAIGLRPLGMNDVRWWAEEES